MNFKRVFNRHTIMGLCKENFDAASIEKHDKMMTYSDYMEIGHEIEDEYFIKNRGIALYNRAIGHLCKKIKSCTADKQLFSHIEDYICNSKNIAVKWIGKSKHQII